MGKRVITQKDVLLIPENGTLRIEGDYLLTPTAKDIIGSKNIKVEEVLENLSNELEENEMAEENIDVFPQNSSRVVISIFGKEKAGVIAAFSKALADENISINDVSQRILGKLFTLFMIVNLGDKTKEYAQIRDKLMALAKELNVKIYIQHESIFQYMHRI